jgi:acylphosphatase
LRVRVRVFGSVQGVGFRYFVREVAESSDLKGWVRNVDDGSVEALFDGPEEDVGHAVEMCRQGPPGASVDRLVVTPEKDGEAFFGFRITY